MSVLGGEFSDAELASLVPYFVKKPHLMKALTPRELASLRLMVRQTLKERGR